MSTLKEKAAQILIEKQTKIIPSNLPDNVTAFGVQGSITTIPSGSSASYIDMDATTYGDWGDGYRTLECTFNSDTLHKSGSSISVPLTNPNMETNLVQNMGITADKIKKDETILGVTGTYEGGIDTSDATATENDIEKNKTAYVDGQLIIGAVEKQYALNLGRDDFAQLEVDSSNNLSILVEMTDKCILQENASINISVDNDLIIEEAGITADKIVEGESIFGVEGIAQTGGEGYTGYYVGEGSSWNTGDASVSIYDNRKLEFSMTHLYQDNLIIAPEGGVGIDATFSDVATAIGLTPGKIKKGVTIMNITGTYEGSGSGSINLTDDVSFMGSDFVTLPDWIINANWSTLRDPVEMFSNCWQLDEIPAIDISNCHTLNAMFRGCTNLIIVPVLNVNRTEDMFDMWSGCSNLSNDSLNNIMTMCINATSNFVGTKTLAYIGLTETQADICETLSKYSDFISAGWTTGY